MKLVKSHNNLALLKRTIYQLFKWLLILFLVNLIKPAAIVYSSTWDFSVPQPKQFEIQDKYIYIGSNSKLEIPAELRTLFKAAVQDMESSLNGLPTQTNPTKIKGDLLSTVISTMPQISEALKHTEGYTISITSDSVNIVGADPSGLLNGLTVLESIIKTRSGIVPQCQINDWPDLKIRALHFQATGVRVEDAFDMIRKARQSHFNLIVIDLSYGVRGLPSMTKIALPNSWTKEDLLTVAKFSRENGMEIIPELPLLTHQERLLSRNYPQLIFNAYTYDPRNEETFNTIFPMVNDLLDLLHPKALHIGHDEVIGIKPSVGEDFKKKGFHALPSELFLMDVKRLNEYLTSRGVDTWMWGDMLISPDEFPDLKDRIADNIHGYFGLQGYSALRKRIPRNIVICDWHYFDTQNEFPSAKVFADAGHQVLGSTWDDSQNTRNFSRYIASMPTGGLGMIATTWFHVQQKRWDVVQRIIQISGAAFWNAK